MPRKQPPPSHERWRFDTKSVLQIVTLACAALLLWTENRHAVRSINEAVNRYEASTNERFETVTKDLDRRGQEFLEGLREIRDEVRSLKIDHVRAAQFQNWRNMAEAANKPKYPDLVWPELPR